MSEEVKEPFVVVVEESNRQVYSGGFIGDTAYVREIAIPAGQEKDAHAHWIAHTGNCLSGHALVPWFDLDTREFGVYDIRVPAKIDIPMRRLHQVIAITDVKWECWFLRAEAERVYGEEAPKVQWWMDMPLGPEYAEAQEKFNLFLAETRAKHYYEKATELDRKVRELEARRNALWDEVQRRDLWSRFCRLGYGRRGG